jgi:hypothetical protein
MRGPGCAAIGSIPAAGLPFARTAGRRDTIAYFEALLQEDSVRTMVSGETATQGTNGT